MLHCCGTVFRNVNTTTTLSESPSTPYTPSHTHISFAGCCDLIAEIALTLNKEKMNIQEAKQLVVSFQNNKELLVSSNKSFVRIHVRHLYGFTCNSLGETSQLVVSVDRYSIPSYIICAIHIPQTTDQL